MTFLIEIYFLLGYPFTVHASYFKVILNKRFAMLELYLRNSNYDSCSEVLCCFSILLVCLFVCFISELRVSLKLNYHLKDNITL